MDKRLAKAIKGCLKNERRAQFALYQICFEHLMSICQRYKRNREDAVALLNDGFLKILLNLKSYDSDRDFFAWAATIMTRVSIDDFRKQRSYKRDIELTDENLHLENPQYTARQLQKAKELSTEEIREMIFGLPEIERMVFILCEWEGYTHSEIAKKLDFSVRSSKRKLQQAKLSLQKSLAEKEPINKV